MLNFGRCRFEFKSYTYTRPLSSLVDNTSPFCQAIRKHGTELPWFLFSAGRGQKMKPSNLLLSMRLSSWFFGSGGSLLTIWNLTVSSYFTS